MKFQKCPVCGNIVGFVLDKGVPLMCCGKKMETLEPGAVEGSHEKHVPVLNIDGTKVTVDVGSVLHPMTDEHNICWVALETKYGNQRKEVKGDPRAYFAICEKDEVVAAYAYCNLHGLWKADA